MSFKEWNDELTFLFWPSRDWLVLEECFLLRAGGPTSAIAIPLVVVPNNDCCSKFDDSDEGWGLFSKGGTNMGILRMDFFPPCQLAGACGTPLEDGGCSSLT